MFCGVKWMKDYSLFMKIFINFIVLLFIMVLIIGAIFNYSIIEYAEDEISKASIGKLRIIHTINDMLVDNVSREALNLSLNDYLNEMSYDFEDADASDTAADIMNMRSIMNVLSRMVNVNEGIQSIYIYLEDMQYIISSRTGVDYIDNFYDTGWINKYKEKKEQGIKAFWLKSRIPINDDMMRDKDKIRFLDLSSEYVISYVYPLSQYTMLSDGAIVVNVSEDRFTRLINNNNSHHEDHIFIINSDGDVISHTDRNLLAKNILERDYIREIVEAESEEGSLITDVEERRGLITYYKSELNDWIYIGHFSLDTLMGKVRALRLKVTFAIFLLAIIGIGISYHIARRLYDPVNMLVQNIKSQKAIDISNTKDEVTILSKAFEAILKQRNNLNNILEKNKRNIQDKYLVDLVNGINRKNTDNNSIEMNFHLPYFACAVLCIDRYKVFSTTFSKEQQNYMKTLMINVCEEVIGNAFKCHGVALEKEKILLIMNMGEEHAGKETTYLDSYFEHIQEEVAKILDNTITVGIGNIYTGLESIKLSYAEALEISKRRLVSGYGSIIKWEPEQEVQHQYYYPANLEQLIINCLNNGTKDGVTNAVNALIEDIKGREGINFDNVMLIFNQLLGRIMESLLQLNISVSNVFGENYNIYQQLLTKETVDEIGMWLIEIFTHMIEYSENRKTDDKKYIDRAMEYIHINYRKDIDVNTLAQHVGISYSQLRRVFISELNVNVVNYINNLRIEEAKGLLCQTDMNILDIALGLGYNNDQSFNRYFKKFEGITPGEYRNRNKHE